jgi:SP family sugar:H+ symporter-like MFS transporter
MQLAIVIGIFCATSINYFATKYSGGAQNLLWLSFETWRWMFWMGTIPAFLYGLLVLTIPESPFFLVAKNNITKAEKILKKLINMEAADKIKNIQKTIIAGRPPKFLDLLCKNQKEKLRFYPIVIAGLVIAVLQQLVGINVIFYYGNLLWQSVGFKEEQSIMLSTVSSIVNIFTAAIAIAFIDKKGRRPLLLIGSAGMFFMLVTMAVVFASAQIDANSNPVLRGIAAYIAVAAANIYIIFFGMSWGPVMWVILGEMFNNKIRGAALSLAILVQWLSNFVVSSTFPQLIKNLGLAGAYGIYAFFAIFSFFFVLNKVQETKGKELEDM